MPSLLPHVLIVPEASSAAKAWRVDAIETKPLPVGASRPSSDGPPLPPEKSSPHALTVPAASSAAKALNVDAMETKPLPVGAL